MLTAELVSEVSRTAVPAVVSGWALTVRELIERTVGPDWEGCYYLLTPAAAERIANEINEAEPWRVRTVAPALTAGEAIRSIAAATRPVEKLDILCECQPDYACEHNGLVLEGEVIP